jgi:hypothetical protein
MNIVPVDEENGQGDFDHCQWGMMSVHRREFSADLPGNASSDDASRERTKTTHLHRTPSTG